MEIINPSGVVLVRCNRSVRAKRACRYRAIYLVVRVKLKHHCLFRSWSRLSVYRPGLQYGMTLRFLSKEENR